MGGGREGQRDREAGVGGEGGSGGERLVEGTGGIEGGHREGGHKSPRLTHLPPVDRMPPPLPPPLPPLPPLPPASPPPPLLPPPRTGARGAAGGGGTAAPPPRKRRRTRTWWLLILRLPCRLCRSRWRRRRWRRRPACLRRSRRSLLCRRSLQRRSPADAAAEQPLEGALVTGTRSCDALSSRRCQGAPLVAHTHATRCA